MWDCKHRKAEDRCDRRKTVCFPGGIGCVLKGKFVFPLRAEQDPLAKNMKADMTTSGKIVTALMMKKLMVKYRKAGKTVAFTNGCFDILHYGHVSYLEAAKKNDTRILVIGLNSDKSVRMLSKGPERPIVPQKERALLLAALACVDHVVLFNESTPQKLIATLKPDILLKGADWKGKTVAGADVVTKNGGRVEFVEYLPGLSTTNIVEKIRKCG